MADVIFPVVPRRGRFRRRPLRAMLLRCALLAVLFTPALVSAATAKPKTSVADLRYGVALYDYYQQDYLSALSELMVADVRDGIQGHGDNPELVAAGISLAFGMENHAEQQFNELLADQSQPQSVRDAAWFYLGKLHYTRGDWEAAAQSFARVSPAFKPALLAEVEALNINIAIHRDTFTPIPLKQLGRDELRDWSPYTLYNLGAGFARHGDYDQAKQYFRALNALEMPASSERQREYLALQDKAHTAMGYTYLLQKSYSAAIDEFVQVRLDGLQSNQALLGYGWAALEQENYDIALKPWQILRQRSLIYPAVQESLLALPFAYEKLGAEGDALSAYETAEKLLGNEIYLVQEMRSRLTQAELLEIIDSEPLPTAELDAAAADPQHDRTTLSAVITDDGQNWLKLDKTSVIKTRSAYLIELFARNDFQAAVLDLRDLLRLRHLLQAWLPKLEIYRDLLLEKKALRQRQEQQLAQQALAQQQQALQLKRDALAARLRTIVENNDAMALADDDTRALYKMVEESERILARMAEAGEESGDAAARLRMYRGILQWRAAQAMPDAQWRNEANLAQIDEALEQLQATRARIDAIMATSLDIQPILERIDLLQNRTRAQLAQTNQAIDLRAAALRAQVDQQLASHQTRLKAYLAQAHLAVARLYDAALRKAQ